MTSNPQSGTISVHLLKRLLIGIGDLHGHYTALHELLDALDRQYRIFVPGSQKIAGDIELVFTGDYIDRGRENRRVVETCMQLKADSPEDVHELFGNHELLALAGLDKVRDILRDEDPRLLGAYRMYTSHGRNGGDAFVREFGPDEKPALESYAREMSRGSPTGDWIRNLEAARLVRIHNHSILFVHGGVPYGIVDRTDLKDYLSRFTEHMSHTTLQHGGSPVKYIAEHLTDDHSVFWDRRIPKMDEQDIRELREDLNVDYIVIGHTPQRRITNYFDIAFNIDAGMTPAYGANEPAAIVFKREGVHAFYARRGEEILVGY